jgi:hypothetical protein
MRTSLERSQPKRSNILKKIKVEGNLDERREVIVCCKAATLKWKGFESYYKGIHTKEGLGRSHQKNCKLAQDCKDVPEGIALHIAYRLQYIIHSSVSG